MRDALVDRPAERGEKPAERALAESVPFARPDVQVIDELA